MKLVYTLVDSGSEECLNSRGLFEELRLTGVPLEVLLIMANGSRNWVSTFGTDFKIGPVDSEVKFEVNQALLMNELPSIENNFPTSENLFFFKKFSDLVNNGKFPKLIDSRLNVIIGIRQTELINYEKIRNQPARSDEPIASKCKLGWTIFGPDPHVETQTNTQK